MGCRFLSNSLKQWEVRDAAASIGRRAFACLAEAVLSPLGFPAVRQTLLLPFNREGQRTHTHIQQVLLSCSGSLILETFAFRKSCIVNVEERIIM